jgi:hypothetical protein
VAEVVAPPESDEPVRICACGRVALEDGWHVRCPACGVIRAWGVRLNGEMVYRAPKKRASPRVTARVVPAA